MLPDVVPIASPMGLFVTLPEPTAAMKKEAASSGVLDTPFGKFARLQILTIEDLFAGKKPAMPPEDPAAFITQIAFRRLTRPSATVRLHLPSRRQIQHTLPWSLSLLCLLAVCLLVRVIAHPAS